MNTNRAKVLARTLLECFDTVEEAHSAYKRTMQNNCTLSDFKILLTDKTKRFSHQFQPTNGCIMVNESSIEDAFALVRGALNAHPDIYCDWVDGIDITT